MGHCGKLIFKMGASFRPAQRSRYRHSTPHTCQINQFLSSYLCESKDKIYETFLEDMHNRDDQGGSVKVYRQ